MRMMRYLCVAVTCVALGCSDAKKGDTPKVEADSMTKGGGENAKKVVEENAKKNPGVKAAGPTGETTTVPEK